MDQQAAATTEQPVSDLEVAAQYADAELQSVVAQFETAAVVTVAPTAAAAQADTSSSDSEKEDGQPKEDQPKEDAAEDSSSDSDSGDEEEEDPAKLRAAIEAALEKEDNKTDGPLKTANEVAAPVREPSVELSADCPIAPCGTILNVSVPGLMMTIKSNPNTKPLEEGSVLCLEDRTVLGCVDEVFGPVLMPMYLVRYEKASKMSDKATVNTAVFYPTEHVTYIVPENIKDKGTDASNIFDEEADDADFSDDEAEAAAKRNRKRNRGGAHPATAGASSFGGRGGRSGRGGRGGNFHDYQSGQAAPVYGGGGPYTQQQYPAMQTQPYGGVTKYTQSQGAGGYGAPRAPMPYGNANYPPTQNYGAPQPPMPPYGMPQPRPAQQMRGQTYYQPPPQYSAHNLPPYPPQAPPPQQTPYPPQPPTGQYPQPPLPSNYYGANTQQGPHGNQRYQ